MSASPALSPDVELQALRGRLSCDEPMSRHTHWRVGGPARLFFVPADRSDLAEFLRALDPALPVHFVGMGSNLLVRDAGIHGAVVALRRAFRELKRSGSSVEAGAGLPCTALARACSSWGLGPADFFAGIPGTVGGALAMNAGAFGGETWDSVHSVETLDRGGREHRRARGRYRPGYRQLEGPADECFLTARFEFETTRETGRLRSLMAERRRRQPLDLPSCGSVFRNPPGGFAGELIERAGLKGMREGAAEVSPKHANFIVNHGGATAADIERLILRVQATVRSDCGVTLQPEVRILGGGPEPAP